MQSAIKPSKKLLESASKIVANSSDFALLNDQIVARNIILSKIRSARTKNEKSVILIKGGPGTGKTVIALHIFAEIANSKNKRSVFFSTKSKPLLEGIKNRLERGSNAKLLFTNLNQFIPSRVDENSIDVLLIDEAHRIGKTSNHQYNKSIDRTDL
jgi:superfamily II DNA or RNA helicase